MKINPSTLETVGSVQGLLASPECIDQIRIIILEDKQNTETTIYRIQKGYRIQFILGASLQGQEIFIYCNHPENLTETLDHNRYRILKKIQNQNGDYYEVVARRSGSYHYYFSYEESSLSSSRGCGYFIVDPVISVGCSEPLPLDCIQCQTVLTKSLGAFDSWEKKLLVAKESGYNMVHFTPIQELGASNSSYSLSDQLKLNPIFNTKGKPEVTYADIEKLTEKMRSEWKMASICDIVLNHTANESPWLIDHPECTYNLNNTPHLRPAYLFDAVLHQLTVEIGEGVWEMSGIPKSVHTEDHLQAIYFTLMNNHLPRIRIPDLYLLDINDIVTQFNELIRSKIPPTSNSSSLENESLKIIQDPEFRRLRSTIDMELALRIYNVYRPDCFDEETRLRRCCETFKRRLEELNAAKYSEIQAHIIEGVDNCISGIRYWRLKDSASEVSPVSIKDPLVPRYFTSPSNSNDIEAQEQLMYTLEANLIWAHNGWVMDANPLLDFATSDSNVYLRRELIAWGDSVKLRYGESPKDCPFLWERMRLYVEATARSFDGVRIDNCHSTPIHLAENLLEAARKIKPDLYVVAELFTNSDHQDNIFVNRLGITSLIREAMSSWDSHELGRLVYRFGGEPVGAFYQPSERLMTPSVAHALFHDLTHDNPSPVESRSVYNLLPSAALVAAACCASGSNRGYDELVPHHIHVVNETRQYCEWSEHGNENGKVSLKTGIIAAKRALNNLHFQLGMAGFNQVYVDQVDSDIVAVTRHCPTTHATVVLVAYTAFTPPSRERSQSIKPLRVEGRVDEIILEATLVSGNYRNGGTRFSKPENFIRDLKWINGLDQYNVELKEHLQLNNSSMLQISDSGDSNITQMRFTAEFQPGSVVALRVSLPSDRVAALGRIRELLKPSSISSASALADYNQLIRCVNGLDLVDLNRVLYRCEAEERDEGHGSGVYDIPEYGPLVYCGFQGFISLLADIRINNDLGHPMCDNLRNGNWMMDYISDRLQYWSKTQPLGECIQKIFTPIKTSAPRFLVPGYADIVLTCIYRLLIDRCWSLMSEFIQNGSSFVRALALGSVQLTGVVKSNTLPDLSPSMALPLPSPNISAVLSAGLPHFSTGYMRSWGRDTFIALRGLLILTGRFQEARWHILAYGGQLRHGLIPNLLSGGGENSRFNCRDAVWWWLHCIRCYVCETPNGETILQDIVSRAFPNDDSPALPPGEKDQLLQEVIQEVLTIHFQGLCFRERNAGSKIDQHMTDKGFNNQIGVHPDTGFIFGGNAWNCGTWMDKMGSSEKAGNRGKPATPRDGSAVELVGLCYSVLVWLDGLHSRGLIPYNQVTRIQRDGNKISWTYKEWADRIRRNFEPHFYISSSASDDGERRPDLVHRRGIYKDALGASQAWTDYQLRPNFPIVMVVAPELFEPTNAWQALQQAEQLLLGPLGMRTLDPADWAYNGDYDNDNDSCDPKIANGFNYHQGPEWLWPVGYLLRALLRFAPLVGGEAELKRTSSRVRSILGRHWSALQATPWRSLPELTNKNGAPCPGSCTSQAWSIATILETLYDLEKIEAEQTFPKTIASSK